MAVVERVETRDFWGSRKPRIHNRDLIIHSPFNIVPLPPAHPNGVDRARGSLLSPDFTKYLLINETLELCAVGLIYLVFVLLHVRVRDNISAS